MSNQSESNHASLGNPGGFNAFDELMGGGFSARRTTLLLGGTQAGKTVLALQALVSSAARGEPDIFVSFEEDPNQLRQLAAGFGWNLAEHERENRVLLYGRVKPPLADAGALDVPALLASLEREVKDLRARRIVFDGLQGLLALLSDQNAQVDEIFRLRDWVVAQELACILTADGQRLPSAQGKPGRYCLPEFIADGVVALSYRIEGDRVSRFLRVLNYRTAVFSSEEFPFSIGPAGIEVAVPAQGASPAVKRSPLPLPELESARRNLSSRLQALDEFLEVKQAELDFLLEKKVPSDPPPELPKAGNSGERITL